MIAFKQVNHWVKGLMTRQEISNLSSAKIAKLSTSQIKELLTGQTNELTKKDEQIDALASKVKWYEEQFKLLKAKKYGKSSEKECPGQLSLFDENEEEVEVERASEQQEEVCHERRGGM